MKLRGVALECVFLGMVVFGFGCSEDPSTQPQAGFISVQVMDISSNQPVADVEIMIANQVARTDANGIAVFEVGVGDYFVDARVCCIGPGFIEHHVPIAVTAGKTVEVALHACSACV